MDRNKTSTNPDTFRDLLAISAEGLALFHPSLDTDHGGSVGDCGYLEAGRFWKLFNVLDPPAGIPGLPRPENGRRRTEALPNNGVLKSSNTSSFSLRGGSPFSLPPFDIDASLAVSQNETAVAFLAFGGRTHEVDEWNEKRVLQLYLATNEELIMKTFWTTPVAECGLLLLYGTTKVNAWCGGVARGLSTSVRGSIQVTVAGVQVVDISANSDASDAWVSHSEASATPNWAFTRGPVEASSTADTTNHCVIVRPVSVRRRDRFRHKARAFLEVRSPSGSSHKEFSTRRVGESSPSGSASSGCSSSASNNTQPTTSGSDTSQYAVDSEDLHTCDLSDGDDVDTVAPTLLDRILESVLDEDESISLVVGDWSMISTYVQNYDGFPGPHCRKLIDFSQNNAGDRIAFVRKLLPGPEGARTAYMNVVARLSNMVAQTSQDAEIPTTPPSPRESPGGISRARADFLNASGPYTSAKARETERKSIINEILETEREYIRDLEIMQQFADELSTKSINDRDTLQRMLPNLLALLNFQQRFLISMEHVAEQPWPQQEWGRLFSDNEEGFQVYQTYCESYSHATDIVLNNNSTLQGFTTVISTSELPALLIKPVRRVCKYLLLLENLINAAQGFDYPFLDELHAGLLSVKRIADKINEYERQMENRQMVDALKSRIKDWRGYHLTQFGELLLDDVLAITKSDVDREYHVFLFEKIILCCKDASLRNGGKSSRLLKEQGKTPLTPNIIEDAAVARKRMTPLLLKGRIFLNNVTGALPQFVNGVWLLHVQWKGEDGGDHFTLRCNKEEQLRLWENAVNRLVHDIQTRRASEKAEKAELLRVGRQPNSTNPAHHEKAYSIASFSQLSISSSSTLPPYPGPPNGWDRSMAGDDDQPHSIPVGGYYAAQQGSRSHISSLDSGFEDDQDDSGYPGSGYARSKYDASDPSTPLGRRGNVPKSMPPERDPAPGYQPTRARTEGAGGQLHREWTRGMALLSPVPTDVLELATPPCEFPLEYSAPPLPPSQLVTVKVHYGEDLFVISVPRATEFNSFENKVGKKVRLCGPRREVQPLRIKYRDEDGDIVSLATNEDLQLAFESPQVTLYVQ